MAPPPGLLGPPSLHSPAPPSSAGKRNKSSQNPCQNIFFSDTRFSTLANRLKEAWTHNPLATLELIPRLRGAEIAGKISNEAFYVAMHWLHQNHPLTLACNVRVFASFGCLKDLLKILRRVLEDEEVDIEGNKIKKEIEREREWWKSEIIEEKNTEKVIQEEEKNPNDLRKNKAIARAKKAADRFAHDANYRFLHNQISDSIAELLESDLQFLESGESEKISLASRWCPSIDSSYDNSTLICENIARKLFPKSDDEYRCLEEGHYSYRVRIRLQKQVLIPLRKALDGANREDEKGIRVYKKSSPRLRYFPHKIVASLKGAGQFSSKLADLHWQNLIKHLSKKGNLNNCLAICNVSEAMGSSLVNFSIAMGLLISELSQKPWKGRVFGFQSNPKLFNIEGNDLKSKVEFMRKMKCDKKLNLSNVHGEVLKFAANRKLSQDKMVKKIFVFTDEGYYKEITHDYPPYRYRSQGYEAVPEIVIWNVSGRGKSRPCWEDHVVHGASERLVNRFFEEGDALISKDVVKLVPRPEDVMGSVISTYEFRDLFVLD